MSRPPNPPRLSKRPMKRPSLRQRRLAEPVDPGEALGEEPDEERHRQADDVEVVAVDPAHEPGAPALDRIPARSFLPFACPDVDAELTRPVRQLGDRLGLPASMRAYDLDRVRLLGPPLLVARLDDVERDVELVEDRLALGRSRRQEQRWSGRGVSHAWTKCGRRSNELRSQNVRQTADRGNPARPLCGVAQSTPCVLPRSAPTATFVPTLSSEVPGNGAARPPQGPGT